MLSIEKQSEKAVELQTLSLYLTNDLPSDSEITVDFATGLDPSHYTETSYENTISPPVGGGDFLSSEGSQRFCDIGRYKFIYKHKDGMESESIYALNLVTYFIHLILVIYFVSNVVLGHQEGYFQTASVANVLSKFVADYEFSDITNMRLMWDYLENVVFKYVYRDAEFSFYTDAEVPPELDRLAGSKGYLLGGVRFRIERNKFTTCKNKEFNVDYMCVGDEVETKPMIRFQNVPYINTTIHWKKRKELQEQYVYWGATRPIRGGNGYAWDFPNTLTQESRQISFKQLHALRDNYFIDSQTSVLFVDFNIYQPDSTLYSVVRIVFDVNPGGLLIPEFDCKTWNFRIWNHQYTYFFVFCFSTFVLRLFIEHYYKLSKCRENFDSNHHILTSPMLPESDLFDAINISAHKKFLVKRKRFFKCLGDLKFQMKVSDVNPSLYRSSRNLGAMTDIQMLVEEALNAPLCIFNEEANYFHISVRKVQFISCDDPICLKATFELSHKIVSIMSTERFYNKLQKQLIIMLKSPAAEIVCQYEKTRIDELCGYGISFFYGNLINVYELFIILFTSGQIILFSFSHITVPYTTLDNIEHFQSLRAAHFYWYIITSAYSLGMFLISIKILYATINFTDQFSWIFLLIAKAKDRLTGFVLFYIIIIAVFAISGWTIFSFKLSVFRTLSYSVLNLMRWMFCDCPYESFALEYPILGDIYYFFWSLATYIILTNILIAIIVDAFTELENERENDGLTAEDEMFNFKYCIKWLYHQIMWKCFGKEKRFDTDKQYHATKIIWAKSYPAGIPIDVLRNYLKYYSVDKDLAMTFMDMWNFPPVVPVSQFEDFTHQLYSLVNDANIRSIHSYHTKLAKKCDSILRRGFKRMKANEHFMTQQQLKMLELIDEIEFLGKEIKKVVKDKESENIKLLASQTVWG